MVVGIPVALPAQSGPALWFRIHEPCQWVGVLVMIAALVIICVDAGVLSSAVVAASSTSGAHQIIGIIVIALAVSQPVFAFCRKGCCPAKLAPEVRKAAHDRWHVLHAVVGGTSLALAIVALPLGIRELSSGGAINGVFIAGYVILLVSLFLGSIGACAASCCNRKKLSERGDPAVDHSGGGGTATTLAPQCTALPYVGWWWWWRRWRRPGGERAVDRMTFEEFP